MQLQVNARTAALIALQWIGAVIAFVISLTLGSMVLPLPRVITDATPPAGILALPGAMLLNGVVNATIVLWAARRSSFKGLAMWLQLLALSFGAQTFMTQIETGYFLSAFPLLKASFGAYLLILHGFVTSLVFTLLVVCLVGGFVRRPRAVTRFTVSADQAVRAGSWLALVYVVLYMLFGYYVAWQSQDVRLFYTGTAQMPSFLNQWGTTLMARPELPVFQYFRGILWLLCLIPLFRGFSGRRLELVILSLLALALLPTAALTFPNPLMPAGVALAHFWEVSISTGIYGALCAWFVPRPEAPA